ncbi:PA14 domain-containing protein [Leptolyngbya sp. NIES-2104]|uniref:PA14 domain-containing protein n=1 Tax=Leptolyngbya sp. NIES-2104 TaxID=1552121 RepID=UPI0006ECBEEE|nr:PA14 domain-containing protein [Leptolyngbya sp. NIES-2104]GAP97528.1 MSHA biogenesis protein MshQ [Leptolyngbya sp. NIES-2104]
MVLDPTSTQGEIGSFSLPKNLTAALSTDPNPDTLFPLLNVVAASSSTTYGAIGLKAEYFNDADLNQRSLIRTDPTIDFNWGGNSPTQAVNRDNFSVRWTGQISPLYSESYTFSAEADDRIRVWINDQLLIDRWDVPSDRNSTINLDAGQNYDLRVEYAEFGGDASAKLYWASPSQTREIIPQSQLKSPFISTNTNSGAALMGDARDIDINSLTSINDSLSSENLSDFYRFTLTQSTAINVTIGNLAANVDLKLLNERGDIISTSANDGTMMESISAVLSAGTYMLQVFSGQPVNTQYVMTSAIADTIRERARPADTFIDSMGINTHLRYTGLSYGRFDDVVEPRLKELGLRHIRDGGNDPNLYPKIRRLAQSGIKTTLIMDPRDGVTPDNAVSLIKAGMPGIEAVEGPNEWDVGNMTYKGANYPDGLRLYQSELYRAVKNDPVTAKLPVLIPSMAQPEHAEKIGSLGEYSDYGNMHSYSGGRVPAFDFDRRWLPLTRKYSDNKTIIVTETGYHNGINDRETTHKAVTEQVSAKYIPRTFLEFFNRGIKRTFLYEFLDQRPLPDSENNYGIIRHDGTPKPAFYALRNMIRVLNDKPGSTASGSLSYYFSGDVKDLRHMLLQKSNGEFYLVMWLNSESTEATKTQRVTVNLLTPTKEAATFLPNRSDSATATFSTPSRVTMDVPDAPIILKVVPRA